MPVDVLALPRRHLDRRLHLRLPSGSAAMSAATHAHDAALAHGHGHGHEHDHGHEAPHGSLQSYLIGFALSVLLTAVPFGLVMAGVLPAAITGYLVVAFAAVQIVVHMVFFLHMNARAE